MKTVLALALLFLTFPAAARRADRVDADFKKIDQLIERGEYTRARDALDDVLAELRPGDPRLVRYHERVGAAWLREGDISMARSSFTSALRVIQRLKVSDDAAARAYAGMGLCLRREENDSYALKFFKRALGFKLDEGTRMFVEDQIREIEGLPPVPAR